MAAGDTKFLGNMIEAMANNTLTTLWTGASAVKIALITSATTPSVNDSNPCWGAGGSQNYSTNEVAAGGNYTAGGTVLSGCTTVQTNNVVALNATSPVTWAANASNPTNARWAIIYNNTTTNKEVYGYIDLGAATSLVPGLQINFNSTSSGVQPVFQGTATP
jgi:hypothetical protein